MRITKFHKPILLTVIGLASLGLLLFSPRHASAANPTTINFQGKIVNFTDGTNITNPNNTYSIVFRIYNTASPTMTTSCTSTASCLWQETQASVQLTNGIFQVELGSSCALTSSSCNNAAGGPINFTTSSSLYLTMQFNGDTSGSNGGFMSPLIHITSVPFAFQADNAASLGGVAAANYVQLATGTVQADSSSNDSISINKTGASGNIATFQSGNTTVFAIGNTGALTLTPKGNNVGTIVRQTSGTATSGNIFDIQGANGTSHFIQVAETAANAGSISITSLGSNSVTIDSGSGTVVFGSTTTTIQKSGSAFTIDVSNGASNSQLNVSDSGGAGNITLNLDAGGSYAVGGTTGTTAGACGTGQFLKGTLSGGIVTSGSCASAYNTVQDEGTNLTQRSTINFTGAGVSCADNSGSTRTDCTIAGGGSGTLASTYNSAGTTGNTIQLANAGDGIILQDASSSTITDFFTVQSNSGSSFKYLSLTMASSVPHLRVYKTSDNTKYADIYWDTTNNVAVFAASTGTTQIGTTSGPIQLLPGTGNGVTITADAASTYTTTTGALTLTAAAASTWSTSAGLLTVQGAGGVSLLAATTTTVTVDSGTTGNVVIGATNNTSAKNVALGNNNSGSTLDIDGGTGATGIEIGNTTTAHGIQIGSNATGDNDIVIGGTNTGSTLTLEAGTASGSLAIGNGATAHNIQIGTGAAVQTVTLGSTNGASDTNIQGGSGDITLTTSAGNTVQIGSGTSDTDVVLFQLDSDSDFSADEATCNTTTNQGALYYNTTTNAIRACINSSWDDLTSTGGLGIYLFGVVSDSSNAGTVGDLAGSSGNNNSPCKVYWSATQQITVAPCTAYSGGRKVIVASTPLSTTGKTASNFYNICLDGTNSQPQIETTGSATESSAGLPTWNANNPVLCLATIQISTTAGNITAGHIYDIRTFTNTQKTFVSINAASALGVAVITSTTTLGNVTLPTAATNTNIKGVIVARNSTNSSTVPNAIIATQGPQWVKATGTSSIGGWVTTANTSGYTQTTTSTTTLANTAYYAAMGIASHTIATSCTSNTVGLTDCQYSQFLNPLSIR